MNVEAVDKPASGRTLPHRWAVLLVSLALLVAGATLIQGGGTVLRRLGVVARPQQYVALSLPDPKNLPVEAVPGAPITFDFAISNSTMAVIHQRWVVDVSGPGLAVQEVAHDVATVAPGVIVTTQVGLQMPDTHSTVTVTISAPGQPLAPLVFHVAPASVGATS